MALAGAAPMPAPNGSVPPPPSSALGFAVSPPLQLGIGTPAAGAGAEAMEAGADARWPAGGVGPGGPPRVLVPELTSGPHLRTSVVMACFALFLLMRPWASQALIVPFVLLLTTSTSALWCTPHELVFSLGPVPVCMFKRYIPYKDIERIGEVRGRCRAVAAVASRMLRLWRPLGFAYGLTVGKQLVDFELLADARPANGYDFFGRPVLVSVDEAEDVVALVRFRQKHGPDEPLPASLRRGLAAGRAVQPVKWVVLDVLDLILSWHARNATACDIFGFFIAPLRAIVEQCRGPGAAGAAADDHDRTV